MQIYIDYIHCYSNGFLSVAKGTGQPRVGMLPAAIGNAPFQNSDLGRRPCGVASRRSQYRRHSTETPKSSLSLYAFLMIYRAINRMLSVWEGEPQPSGIMMQRNDGNDVTIVRTWAVTCPDSSGTERASPSTLHQIQADHPENTVR